MKDIAAGLAALGRGNDKMLVHMTPSEVQGLQAMALAHGGSLTINPRTGLPEAGFLSDILPTIVGVGLSMMGVPAWGIGLGSGVTSLATGKDLGSAVTSGLLAGAGSALLGPGAGSAGAPGTVNNAFTGGTSLIPQQTPALDAAVQGAVTPPPSIPQGDITPYVSGIAGAAPDSSQGASLVSEMPMAQPASMNDRYASNPYFNPAAAAPTKTSFTDNPLEWMKQNKPMTAALGLGALGALGGLKQQPLNVPAQPQQGGNYRKQGPNIRPYDPTAPGGYYFTDRGILQPVYVATGGAIHSVPELEDGGFVLTKKAVDGIGKGSNERGQRAAAAGLGSIPIRGPGTGTSDSIPTTIDGERPALVSNGEAYVPRNQVKRRGGAKKFYALMRQAEQEAARRA